MLATARKIAHFFKPSGSEPEPVFHAFHNESSCWCAWWFVKTRNARPRIAFVRGALVFLSGTKKSSFGGMLSSSTSPNHSSPLCRTAAMKLRRDRRSRGP